MAKKFSANGPANSSDLALDVYHFIRNLENACKQLSSSTRVYMKVEVLKSSTLELWVEKIHNEVLDRYRVIDRYKNM